ncbi:MAG: tetratricopeptide repeat protein, partial [Betaproteobacteria bacterium]|nr:tetratricopeptide repeat protein [Betaproteobacteria bacterium]
MHQSGRLDEAARAYRSILQVHPDQFETLHHLGMLEAQQGRFGEALQAASRAVEVNPQSADSLALQANLLQALNRHEEALASYQRVLATAPGNTAALYNLGVLLLGLRRFEEALVNFERALAVEPADVETLTNRGIALHELGRREDALKSYDAALAGRPGFPEALNNRANLLRELGRYPEALASCDQALAARPAYPDALNNRGLVLQALDRAPEALADFERALALQPDFAEAHNNAGLLQEKLGRADDAAARFRRALELNPDFAEAHNNLGMLLKNQGKAGEAIAAYRRAVSLRPAYAEAHSNLGNALLDQGKVEEAEACYRAAVKIDPSSVHANTNLTVALNQLVPSWHIPMMNDGRRNEAYRAALQAAVTPDSDVFEIGTGSGLLAMLAARFGANSVVTCEASPLIAATARAIVADNGLQARVKVLAMKSTAVEVGADLPRRANVMVSEILSSELLAEGVLPSIEDAKKRLLAPGAKIIPAAGSIVVALFGGDRIKKHIRIDDALGFDLKRFNEISSSKRFVYRDDLDIELLSDASAAIVFDFVNRDHFPAETRLLRIPVVTAGLCYGVAQWLRLQMHDSITYENHPSTKTDASTWQTCLYRFAEPLDVTPGQT